MPDVLMALALIALAACLMLIPRAATRAQQAWEADMARVPGLVGYTSDEQIHALPGEVERWLGRQS